LLYLGKHRSCQTQTDLTAFESDGLATVKKTVVRGHCPCHIASKWHA
jgi:hypothetical protein